MAYQNYVECRKNIPWHGRGVTCSNYILSWMGKAHFQVLSRFVLIGASLISVENDV